MFQKLAYREKAVHDFRTKLLHGEGKVVCYERMRGALSELRRQRQVTNELTFLNREESRHAKY